MADPDVGIIFPGRHVAVPPRSRTRPASNSSGMPRGCRRKSTCPARPTKRNSACRTRRNPRWTASTARTSTPGRPGTSATSKSRPAGRANAWNSSWNGSTGKPASGSTAGRSARKTASSRPQVHDLGMGVTPGKHTLTIRVDNSLKFDLGGFVSILYEGTQTNWNGIVGKIELRAVDPVSIETCRGLSRRRSQAHQGHSVHDRTSIGRAGCQRRHVHRVGQEQWRHGCRRRQTSFVRTPIDRSAPSNCRWATKCQALGRVLAESLRTQSATPPKPARTASSERTVTFGMRKLEIRGTQFVLNGRPIFLRGTLECAIFPLTGYPPTDVPAWQRIFRMLKSYGLNFMRFHSWCPPEAAFAAADIEGVYLQVGRAGGEHPYRPPCPHRPVHGAGAPPHGPHLRQPSVVLPDDPGQRAQRRGRYAWTTGSRCSSAKTRGTSTPRPRPGK